MTAAWRNPCRRPPVLASGLVALALLAGAGCGAPRAALVRLGPDDPGVRVTGLAACRADAPDELVLDPARPVALFVHGCFSSGARFRTLAEVFEAHGQQTACYNYDDRDGIDDSSVGLVRAVEALASRNGQRAVEVLGHSQGGLVARRAFVAERESPVGAAVAERLTLVTVSSPFDGIEAATHCGWSALHVVTLGVSALVCQAITGSKWSEIHPSAHLVEEPGQLVEGVRGHLEVVTDERGTCRNWDGDECVEDDYVFSVEEQTNARVDADPRVDRVVVPDGHAAVVGEGGVVPHKLIGVLQQRGVLAATPPDRQEAMERLLEALYEVRSDPIARAQAAP